MSKIIKRKWKSIRNEFRRDMNLKCSSDKAFAMMVFETYCASQHRTHITKIWSLLGHNHREAYKDYCDKLMGQTLTGRDEIVRNLYFVDNVLYEKYAFKIPECYAMGEALGEALKVLRKG